MPSDNRNVAQSQLNAERVRLNCFFDLTPLGAIRLH